jgi:hypothetical protein
MHLTRGNITYLHRRLETLNLRQVLETSTRDEIRLLITCCHYLKEFDTHRELSLWWGVSRFQLDEILNLNTLEVERARATFIRSTSFLKQVIKFNLLKVRMYNGCSHACGF